MTNNKFIEVLVRAIIKDEQGRVLVCRKKGCDYYFFPGGHIEFGESSTQALRREIKEELGLVVENLTFLGGLEHKFIEDGIERQEINLFYQTQLKEIKSQSQESHLEFYFFTENQIKKEIVYPEVAKNHIDDNKIFWESDIS